MEHEDLVRMSERDFVVSCISSDKVCNVLLQYVRLDFFELPYSRVVMGWVLDYHRDFRSAPKKNVLSLYRLHCEELQDEGLRETVLLFLEKLPDFEESVNEDYLLARCRDFIDYRKLSALIENLQACVDVGNMNDARNFLLKHQQTDLVHSKSIRLFDQSQEGIINEKLNKVDDELFDLPPKIGDVIGKIHREDFIALLAGPKAGKTWFLCWIAKQAMLRGQKVLFVSLEMNEGEVLRRMWSLFFGVKSPTVSVDDTFTLSRWEQCGDKVRPSAYQYEVKRNRTISVKEAQAQVKLVSKGDIWIECYPSFSSSVNDVENRIREVAINGYVPDVVIVDYADIMKPSGGGTELRNQLDSIWKSLRSFAQEMKVAVFTASQTNRAGLGGVVRAENVAEDMRKLAHVTSFVALDRPPHYRRAGIAGLKNLMSRNESSDKEALFCTGYKLGQFMLGGAEWKEDVILDDGGELD